MTSFKHRHIFFSILAIVFSIVLFGCSHPKKAVYKTKEEALTALHRFDGSFSFQSVPLNIKKDKNFILEVLNLRVIPHNEIFKKIPVFYRKDSDVMWVAFYNYDENTDALKYADKSLTSDKSFMLKLIKVTSYALKYADISIINDRELVLAAVSSAFSYSTFDVINKKYREDRGVMLAAIKQDSASITYIDGLLKEDKKLLLIALKHFSTTIDYASDKLKDDEKFIEKAIQIRYQALCSASQRLRKNKKLALSALKKSKDAMRCVSSSIQHTL